MAGLKEIRTRIASVSSTRKITSAMKMVAAAKLRKAQDKIVQLRPYANKLDEILFNVKNSLEGEMDNPLIQERAPEKVLICAHLLKMIVIKVAYKSSIKMIYGNSGSSLAASLAPSVI